jgi:hypothetical protein
LTVAWPAAWTDVRPCLAAIWPHNSAHAAIFCAVMIGISTGQFDNGPVTDDLADLYGSDG